MNQMGHHRTIHVAVFLASLDVALCGAGEPTSPSIDPSSTSHQRLDELVTQLGSDSFIQRDWAARQIAQQGPDVIPRLAKTVEGADGTTAAAVIRLLFQSSRSREARMAAPALQGIISLHEKADTLPPEARELLTNSYQELVRDCLAHLMVFGARIDRDSRQRIVGIIVRSEEFADRHIHWLSPLTSLQRADLRGATITDQGLEQLASLPHLQYLNLSDTRVTGAGLRHLRTLKALTQLIVYRLPLSEEDRAWLDEHLPRCRVSPSAAERRQPR